MELARTMVSNVMVFCLLRLHPSWIAQYNCHSPCAETGSRSKLPY
jgi:hypothetical protein